MLKPLSLFKKNILTMFKGSLIAQIIGFLGTFFLAKIYGPKAYGIYGVYISVISAISICSTLQLEYAIVNVDNKKKLTKTIFSLATIISFILFIIISIVSLFYPFETISYIFLITISSLHLTFSKIFEYYYTSIAKFTTIAYAKVITTVLNIIFQLTLYIFFNLKGLVFGNMISLIVTSIFYWKNTGSFSFTLNTKEIKSQVLNNISIIKHLFPASIINTLVINIIPLCLIFLFSLEDFGVFSLSMKILSAPLILITSSVSNIYYQKAKEIHSISKQSLYSFTKKTVKYNFYLIIISLLFINSIGIYLLELIFDKQWNGLRVFTLISSFIILAKALFNPISEIMIILDKNKVALFLNIYTCIISIFAMLVGYIYNNINYTLFIISIIGGIGYLFSLKYFLDTLKKL